MKVTKSGRSTMYKSYLKSALRAIHKHKEFAALNVLGLAIGMAACLVILQYVAFELSYDNIPQAEDIYRVQNTYVRNGEIITNRAATYPGVGLSMQRDIPEVKTFTRLYHAGAEHATVLTYEKEGPAPVNFKEKRLFFADSSFLPMFSVKMLLGDAKTALSEPNALVLSASAAKRYFGDEDPIGKTLRLNDDGLNEHLCTVTGVVEDVVPNRHLKYDVLVSSKTLYSRPGGVRQYGTRWGGRFYFYTYVLLGPGTNPKAVEAQMPKLVDTYQPRFKELNSKNGRVVWYDFTLYPLEDIHLYSHLSDEVEVNGNGTAVYFLLMVAFFILIIAWINYINMATARSVDRAREVGLRKVLGSTRSQLIKQFLFEAVLLNLMAFILALLLARLAQPFLPWSIDSELASSFWKSPIAWMGGAALFILGTLCSSAYPALILSSFKPVTVLKGRLGSSRQGVWQRKVLVVFQFAVAIALMVGTFTVYQQLDYMYRQDLGFGMDQLLVIEKPGVLGTSQPKWQQRIETFKTTLAQYSGIQSVSVSSEIPGNRIIRGYVVSRGPNSYDDMDDMHSIEFAWVDETFLDAIEVDFLAGRNFSRTFSDSTAVILNESAADVLGFESAEAALGQDLYLGSRFPHKIIGVIKDYHHESLQIAIDPMYFTLQSYAEYTDMYFSVKIQGDHVAETIEQVEEVYKTHFPGNPFNFFFLDASFSAQYKAEQAFGERFRFFAGLVIFIACLGLYGLSAFITVQRTKEIGIRKVLGASAIGVLRVLTKDFIKLVGIAALVALPVAYVGLQQWLEHYAFRIDLELSLFIIPVVLVLLLALLTVSFQTLKAARLNPVESLRTE